MIHETDINSPCCHIWLLNPLGKASFIYQLQLCIYIIPVVFLGLNGCCSYILLPILYVPWYFWLPILFLQPNLRIFWMFQASLQLKGYSCMLGHQRCCKSSTIFNQSIYIAINSFLFYIYLFFGQVFLDYYLSYFNLIWGSFLLVFSSLIAT